ncbi:hypothetical protein N657DRAFT_206802 [Parathielavia appendiculata]|uniref:Uncharacterized protein n=1 Tax=Parathielavia appendiculata TaxID=2587402 RepID=A0AAN6Z701_9PEZI|nr:hypothetical protein N657DRAFT_206802 [Parathielavia appendiculata]
MSLPANIHHSRPPNGAPLLAPDSHPPPWAHAGPTLSPAPARLSHSALPHTYHSTVPRPRFMSLVATHGDVYVQCVHDMLEINKADGAGSSNPPHPGMTRRGSASGLGPPRRHGRVLRETWRVSFSFWACWTTSLSRTRWRLKARRGSSSANGSPVASAWLSC